MTLHARTGTFLSEPEVYCLLSRAGLSPPRHGLLGDVLSFDADEAVVLKGQGAGLLHKSDIGAVRFLSYNIPELSGAAIEMRQRVEAAGFEWLGALVCERVAIARSVGLPTEALVSLRHGDGGWSLLIGLGGLQVEALAEGVPPLCWPMALVTPEQAFDELRQHLLGRIWLGTLRGAPALTSEAQLRAFLGALWRLRDLAESEGLDLVELNPVALDQAGEPRALDGVARLGAPSPRRLPPPGGFLDALLEPRRVALAGVSTAEGGVGRTILDNLRRCDALVDNLLLIKPGHERFLDLPCLPDVAALAADPVDLLVLALPARATADTVSQLLRQGGGARVVALVAGGIGDGGDSDGLGARLSAELQEARAAGRWTPALVGPNFLGHWVPGRDLDSSFIPVEKLAAPARTDGGVALLSQSGAFLLSRRSRNPHLPLGFAMAMGNQLDVAIPDVLEALEAHPEFRAIGLYVEGFGRGHLAATATVARRLSAAGRAVLLHRAGHSPAGQAAAASHTGAIAGDRVLEEALLSRAGVGIARSQQAFDAGLAWLGAYPSLIPGQVTVVTNAGFESVNAADLLVSPFCSASMDPAAEERLQSVLDEEGLAGLVAVRLPLDLTPMANEGGYLKALAALLEGSHEIVVIGLVPFTRRLHTDPPGAGRFAEALAGMARSRGTALGVVVDAGSDYDHYRQALAAAGLPVFTRMEDALAGLQALGGANRFGAQAQLRRREPAGAGNGDSAAPL